jgi:Tfp pilus assembly protein PilF
MIPSTPATTACDDAMQQALEAAHDVDVGDYYFAGKNYRAALLRYKSAADQKPADASIHVRMARTFEKLKQLPQAVEEYKAAQKSPAPTKWKDEAKVALERLQSQAHSSQ